MNRIFITEKGNLRYRVIQLKFLPLITLLLFSACHEQTTQVGNTRLKHQVHLDHAELAELHLSSVQGLFQVLGHYNLLLVF